MKEIGKIYKESPPAGKVLIIAAAITVLVLLYILLSKVFKKIAAGPNAVDAAKDGVNELAKQGIVPNYGTAQFETFADTLEQAMSGLGTDEDAIKSVFDYMQNQADVLQLIKTFGVRNYTDDKVLVFNIKPFNLNQWLAAELSTDDTNFYVNAPLKAKNIDYTF